MQNGRKTASSRKGQVGYSLRKWWESYRQPDLHKFQGGVLQGLIVFPTTLEEEAPLEEFLWRRTIGELLSGGELIALTLLNVMERKQQVERVEDKPRVLSLHP